MGQRQRQPPAVADSHLLAGDLRCAVRPVPQHGLRAAQVGDGLARARRTVIALAERHPRGALTQGVKQQAAGKGRQQPRVQRAAQAGVTAVGQHPGQAQAGPAFHPLALRIEDLHIKAQFAALAAGLVGVQGIGQLGTQQAQLKPRHPHRQHRLLRQAGLQRVQQRIARAGVTGQQGRGLQRPMPARGRARQGARHTGLGIDALVGVQTLETRAVKDQPAVDQGRRRHPGARRRRRRRAGGPCQAPDQAG